MARMNPEQCFTEVSITYRKDHLIIETPGNNYGISNLHLVQQPNIYINFKLNVWIYKYINKSKETNE